VSDRVGNYVSVRPLQVGNYVSADTHARSTLMDEETLLRHRAHWGREATPVTTELGHLTPAEAQLYEALVAGRHAPALRLEQERIRFGDVQRTLTA
jgi:hypothetical protein